MPDYDLKLGERLEVLREDKRGISDIQMITPEGRLVISEPMMGTKRLPVKKNDTLRLCYFRSSGMLSCVVTAERLFKEKGLCLIEVEIRSQVNRNQRRDFVRFDTLLPASILPLTGVPDVEQISDEAGVRLLVDRRLAGADNPDDAIGGFTMDISGGGMRFVSKQPLELGSLADCSIYLNDNDKVTAAIRIVRCEIDHDPNSGGKYFLGAKFIGIEESLRNRIIKYIFNEQLKRRMASRNAGAGRF